MQITIDTHKDSLTVVMATISAAYGAPAAAAAAAAPAAAHVEVTVAAAHVEAPAAVAAPVPAAPAPVESGDSEDEVVDPTSPDAEGYTWDARIHSTPASLTGKGFWRKRKGASVELIAQVQQEQKPITPAPVAAPAPVAVAAPVLPTLPPVVQVASPYAELCGLIGRNLYDEATNPTGRLNTAWVTSALENMSVPGGVLENVATLPADVQGEILKAFQNALG